MSMKDHRGSSSSGRGRGRKGKGKDHGGDANGEKKKKEKQLDKSKNNPTIVKSMGILQMSVNFSRGKIPRDNKICI